MTSFQDIKASKKILGRNYAGLICLGKETLSVTDSSAVGFTTIPNGTINAEFIVEAASGLATQTKAIRTWQDGSTPTASIGYILGDLDTYEITNIENIQKAKFIGIDSSKTHKLQIQYFGEKQ